MRRLISVAVVMTALLTPAAPASGQWVTRIITDGLGNKPGRLYKVAAPEWATIIYIEADDTYYVLFDTNLNFVKKNWQRDEAIYYTGPVKK